jgi:hypothetical protein
VSERWAYESVLRQADHYLSRQGSVGGASWYPCRYASIKIGSRAEEVCDLELLLTGMECAV